jgi:hypothetical protein
MAYRTITVPNPAAATFPTIPVPGSSFWHVLTIAATISSGMSGFQSWVVNAGGDLFPFAGITYGVTPPQFYLWCQFGDTGIPGFDPTALDYRAEALAPCYAPGGTVITVHDYTQAGPPTTYTNVSLFVDDLAYGPAYG